MGDALLNRPKPTVTVRFPHGDFTWPAHFEQRDVFLRGDELAMPPTLTPDPSHDWEFHEVIGHPSWYAVSRQIKI